MGQRLFSKYEVRHELPRLAAGVRCFHAWQTGIDREVELRLYERRDGLSQQDFAELRRVVRLAAALDHPNIIPIFEVGYTNTKLFWTTGFRRAISFDEFLERLGRPLDEAAIVEVARALASALVTMHERGILHRSLSSTTVFYDIDNERPYIADLSLIDDEQVDLSKQMPPWGPRLDKIPPTPELFTGNVYCPRTDLYLLGSTLYRLATARAATNARLSRSTGTLLDTFAVRSPGDFNKELPAWLADLIVQLLSFDPSERPCSAREVLEVLDEEDRLPADDQPSGTISTDHGDLIERIARESAVITSTGTAWSLPAWSLPAWSLPAWSLPAWPMLLALAAVLIFLPIVLSLTFSSTGSTPWLATGTTNLAPEVRRVALELERSPITRANFISRHNLLRSYLDGLDEAQRTKLPREAELSAMKRRYYRSPTRACTELSIAYHRVISAGM